MASQDEFDDIPSLGSARDDLDRSDIPTLKPAGQEVVEPALAAPPAKSSSTALLWFMVILLVAALAGVGYWSQMQISRLEQQLAASEQSLSGALSRMADFETLISATDESASKSGAALQAQLRKQLQEGKQRVSHVDSELRKLWAIYQKYQPKITTLEKQQQQQGKGLSSQKAELKTVGESLDTIGLSLDKQTQALTRTESRLKGVDSAVKKDRRQTESRITELREQLRDQDLANQEVDDLQAARLKELQDQLTRMASAPRVPDSVRKQLAEQQKALDSVNSYRRQVNSELLKLRKRVGQLQLSVDSVPKAVQ